MTPSCPHRCRLAGPCAALFPGCLLQVLWTVELAVQKAAVQMLQRILCPGRGRPPKALHVALAETKQDRQRKARQGGSRHAPDNQVLQRSLLSGHAPQLLHKPVGQRAQSCLMQLEA